MDSENDYFRVIQLDMSLLIDKLVLLKSWPRQIRYVETKRGNSISYVEYRNSWVLEKKSYWGRHQTSPM